MFEESVTPTQSPEQLSIDKWMDLVLPLTEKLEGKFVCSMIKATTPQLWMVKFVKHGEYVELTVTVNKLSKALEFLHILLVKLS